MVATQAGDGMKLYVDGALVASGQSPARSPTTGYWRVGGDNLASWPNQPTSNYFAGSIDEAAGVPERAVRRAGQRPLRQGQRCGERAADGGVHLIGEQPRRLAFDGTSSTDADGTIASYAWNFGDGSTGTGAKPSHTYAAGEHLQRRR